MYNALFSGYDEKEARMKRKMDIQITRFPVASIWIPWVICLIFMSFPTPIQASTVTLSWSAPSEGVVTGYIACYGFQSGSYTEYCQKVENVTQAIFSNIDPAKEYFFAVKSYTESGESKFSEEIAYRASDPQPAPLSTSFEITSSTTSGGGISPSGNVSVTEGDNQSFIISVNPGYELKELLVDGTSIGSNLSYTFQHVAAAHTIHAVFTPVQPVAPAPVKYTISASCGVNGNINPKGKTQVEKNQNLTFFITPSENYITEEILVDGNSVKLASSYTFSDVQRNHTISASFERKHTRQLSPPIRFRISK
jgi:hypothetical protein